MSLVPKRSSISVDMALDNAQSKGQIVNVSQGWPAELIVGTNFENNFNRILEFKEKDIYDVDFEFGLKMMLTFPKGMGLQTALGLICGIRSKIRENRSRLNTIMYVILTGMSKIGSNEALVIDRPDIGSTQMYVKTYGTIRVSHYPPEELSLEEYTSQETVEWLSLMGPVEVTYELIYRESTYSETKLEEWVCPIFPDLPSIFGLIRLDDGKTTTFISSKSDEAQIKSRFKKENEEKTNLKSNKRGIEESKDIWDTRLFSKIGGLLKKQKIEKIRIEQKRQREDDEYEEEDKDQKLKKAKL